VVFPHRSDTSSELKLLEFTVEFEKGTTGSVGWLSCHDAGVETTISPYDLTDSFNNSLFLNITQRKAFGPKVNHSTKILGDNLRINHTESATKVICCRKFVGTHEKQKKYSIELADGTEVDATLSENDDDKIRVLPMISFSGKVKVSGLKYSVDEL
jgi:hypothetical protein